MKTVTINLYRPEELGKDAFTIAFVNYSTQFEYPFFDEVVATLRKALQAFDCSLDGYSLECYSARQSRVRWNNTRDFYINSNEAISAMTPARTFKFIQNNFKGVFEESCPFTGVFYDEAFLDPFRLFMKRPSSLTFTELINEGIYNVLKAMEDEYDGMTSKEGFLEHTESNDKWYTVDGREFTLKTNEELCAS